MAPITIFTTFRIASEVTDSRVPLAYIFTAVALSLTGYCYAYTYAPTYGCFSEDNLGTLEEGKLADIIVL